MARLWLLPAALALSACAEDYGYVYTYDPYLGPRGHYVTFVHAPPYECGRLTYVGPYNRGDFRGDYDSGPYCAPDEGAGQPSPH
jgi:hypothetical protein